MGWAPDGAAGSDEATSEASSTSAPHHRGRPRRRTSGRCPRPVPATLRSPSRSCRLAGPLSASLQRRSRPQTTTWCLAGKLSATAPRGSAVPRSHLSLCRRSADEGSALGRWGRAPVGQRLGPVRPRFGQCSGAGASPSTTRRCVRDWASSGVMHLTGWADGPPVVSPAGHRAPSDRLGGCARFGDRWPWPRRQG